jgi:hypothetical protein
LPEPLMISMPRTPVALDALRGEMHRRIVALLQDYLGGCSPVQTWQLLGAGKDLASTREVVARDGLLRRVETRQYIVATA